MNNAYGSAKKNGSNPSMLVLNSPNNPVGNSFCRSDIELATSWSKENSITVLSDEIYERAKSDFLKKLELVDFNKYYLDGPFKESGLALYNWSPIADDLKVLDKEIVLNSIKLKWNIVENEFKDLTKNLAFDS